MHLYLRIQLAWSENKGGVSTSKLSVPFGGIKVRQKCIDLALSSPLRMCKIQNGIIRLTETEFFFCLLHSFFCIYSNGKSENWLIWDTIHGDVRQCKLSLNRSFPNCVVSRLTAVKKKSMKQLETSKGQKGPKHRRGVLVHQESIRFHTP